MGLIDFHCHWLPEIQLVLSLVLVILPWNANMRGARERDWRDLLQQIHRMRDRNLGRIHVSCFVCDTSSVLLISRTWSGSRSSSRSNGSPPCQRCVALACIRLSSTGSLPRLTVIFLVSRVSATIWLEYILWSIKPLVLSFIESSLPRKSSTVHEFID